MTQWLRAQGWLLSRHTIAQGREFKITCDHPGPRRELQQITVCIEGRGWEYPSTGPVRWSQGTVSTRLPPVPAGEWRARVDDAVDITWLCLDQRYNKFEPMPEVRCLVLSKGQQLCGPGIYYLALGDLNITGRDFQLAPGQHVTAETDSVILQFNRARYDQTTGI